MIVFAYEYLGSIVEKTRHLHPKYYKPIPLKQVELTKSWITNDLYANSRYRSYPDSSADALATLAGSHVFIAGAEDF